MAMELPDAATPEEFFGWFEARGVLTAEQAREAIEAVRREERNGEERDVDQRDGQDRDGEERQRQAQGAREVRR